MSVGEGAWVIELIGAASFPGLVKVNVVLK